MSFYHESAAIGTSPRSQDLVFKLQVLRFWYVFTEPSEVVKDVFIRVLAFPIDVQDSF